MRQLQRVKNWKAPGPDGLQGYWIKTFMLRDNTADDRAWNIMDRLQKGI